MTIMTNWLWSLSASFNDKFISCISLRETIGNEYLLKLCFVLYTAYSRSSSFILFCNCVIYSNLSIIKHCNWFFENTFSIYWFISLERLEDFKASTFFFVCFSKAFPERKYVNLACCIVWVWLESKISSSGRYSCLSILPDDNSDICAAFLSLSYYSFASLTLSLIVIISFYILSSVVMISFYILS